ncbi:hypothetical protein FB451DRAFT_1214879 [Mycena latifolia]|nr:hypothetical protein FB451DRAFT_1214879 [Mycena latifolia]
MPYDLKPDDNSAYVVDDRVERRGVSTTAPLIAGIVFGIAGCILLSCILWVLLRRRQEERDKERAVDLRSRPFPLSVKPGRSRIQPTTIVIPPRPPRLEIASPHRMRRKAPPPPPLRSVAQKEARARRSSISKSILGLRWNLPPVSEGYGVGLMTREVRSLGQASYYQGPTR